MYDVNTCAAEKRHTFRGFLQYNFQGEVYNIAYYASHQEQMFLHCRFPHPLSEPQFHNLVEKVFGRLLLSEMNCHLLPH